MPTLNLNAKRSALLIMDLQRPVVENYAVDPEGLLTAVGGAIAAARGAGQLRPAIWPKVILISSVESPPGYA